jgi:hypothetical protein
MSTNISILVAGFLIAVAVFLTNHWQIAGESDNLFRLNRWTGEISFCQAVQSNAGDAERRTISMSCSAHVNR